MRQDWKVRVTRDGAEGGVRSHLHEALAIEVAAREIACGASSVTVRGMGAGQAGRRLRFDAVRGVVWEERDARGSRWVEVGKWAGDARAWEDDRTIVDVFGELVRWAAPGQYPLTARCRRCGRVIRCESQGARWEHVITC